MPVNMYLPKKIIGKRHGTENYIKLMLSVFFHESPKQI